MNKDTITALAREAGVKPLLYDGKWAVEGLDVFAALVAAHIREECAQVCDEMDKLGAGETVRDAAAAIRGRNA